MMRAAAVLSLLVLSGCSTMHDAASYRGKYARTSFLVEGPITMVVERTADQAGDCLNAEHWRDNGRGHIVINKTRVELNWLSTRRAELLIPAEGEATNPGFKATTWRTFSAIADFSTEGSNTRVTPHARGRQMDKAIRRWALGESPACPNYEL